MPKPVNITEFRQQAGPYFTAAVLNHQPLLIQRGANDRGLLMGEDEALAMVEDRRFNPEVLRSDGSVSVWLPEFEIYGEGSSYEDAKADLLNEVRHYVEEYMVNASEYVRAPNRAAHLPYVIKAYVADCRGELGEVIFPGPPALPNQAVALRDAQPAR